MCTFLRCDRAQRLARGFSRFWPCPLRVPIVVPCSPATGSLQYRRTCTHVLDKHNSLVAASFESLQEVRGKNRKLREILRTSPWPSFNCFRAHGKTYDLPLRHSGPCLVMPSTARLRYLAGFFDGDGCVTPETGLSGCRLVVVQAINQAAVLLLFHDTFGGSITRHGDGIGLQQPTLRWIACGNKATYAAGLLSPFSITKRKQLLLAAAWPQTMLDRHHCRELLVQLKRHDSAVADHCTLEYIAGFFDAEGHVQASGRAALTLEIGQKFGTVLACLKDSLAICLDVNARVLARGKYFYLKVTRTSQCKQVLHALLQAGLLSKADQAKLVISLTSQNSSQVRTALGMRVGKQGFGKRLDEDGLRRSVKIKVVQALAMRLKRRGELSKAELKLQEVEDLRYEHQLLNACRENQQLHEYMCELRRSQGAQ